MDKLNNIIAEMKFEFLAKGTYKTTPAEFLSDNKAVFLDIRAQEEIESISINLKHHMPVIRIALHELPDKIHNIPKHKRIGLFCSSGTRIAMAYLYLRTAGYENVVMISGGLDAIVKELKPGNIFKAVNSRK